MICEWYRYGALPGMPGGYVPSEDYDEVMDDSPAGSLIQAPGAAELNRPLQQEVWYHGPVCHVQLLCHCIRLVH
jgi:hypothetical protein